MSAPRLTHALTLEHAQRSPDGAGGFVTQWAPLGQHWASIKLRSAQKPGAAGPLTRVSATITMRGVGAASPARPRPGQRLRKGDRLFSITGVVEAGPDGRYLTITAEEEQAP